MKTRWLLVVLAGALLASGYATAAPLRFTGVVAESTTLRPVPEAVVTLGRAMVRTGEDGWFAIEGEAAELAVRAPGYRRATVKLTASDAGVVHADLEAFTPHAIYLSAYGIGSAKLRNAALQLAASGSINALVIDVKSDYGMLSYHSAVPLAAQAHALETLTIPDIGRLVEQLHQRGIYLIARLVVFKDHPLATARPDLAVKTREGALFHDREHLAWTDPFQREVREYNIDVAEEAARHGFDEIQFDYVRFPDQPNLVFSQVDTEQSRVETITEFLVEARHRLAPYNVFVAADIFGYVCWNRDDTGVGQRIERLVDAVDYVSPMLYPSAFQWGIPGYRNPVGYPYEIVYLSLERARERTGARGVRFRPWLQAFRDYAFDRREFDRDEIRAQIDAADRFGSDGWMLWNPHNVYPPDAFAPLPAP